jgi:hypothetical protein
MRTTTPLLFLAFVTTLAIGQADSRADEGDLLIERWDAWTRDTLESWRVAKLLLSNDLDKAKRTTAAVSVAWKRLLRGDKVSELLTAKHRETFDRLIAAIIDGSRKWTKAELEQMKRNLENEMATVTTTKNLVVSIARDLDSLKILMNAKLVEAKIMPAEQKKKLKEHVDLLTVEHEVFSTTQIWEEGVETRIQTALQRVEEMIKDL